MFAGGIKTSRRAACSAVACFVCFLFKHDFSYVELYWYWYTSGRAWKKREKEKKKTFVLAAATKVKER